LKVKRDRRGIGWARERGSMPRRLCALGPAAACRPGWPPADAAARGERRGCRGAGTPGDGRAGAVAGAL